MTPRLAFLRQATLVGASLISASAFAQSTPTPGNVTLYGVVDACAVSYHSASGARAQVNGGGCFYGSRVGFRGNEDLGGGLRAYFVLEQGFSADTGALAQGGRVFGRKLHVGLAGAFGLIEAGRDYAPAFYLLSGVDPMQLGLGSALATVWSGSAGTASGRTDNGVHYQTPSFGGFALRLLFAPGELAASPTTASRGGDTQGASVMYRGSALTAGVTYANVRDAGDKGSDSATTIGGKYDFGSFSLAAIAQSGRWEGTRSATAPSSATSIFSRAFRSYVLGGSVKLGGDTLSATFKRYDDRTRADFDADVFSIVYIHPLSKRTQIYGGLTQLNNKRASSYGASDGNGAYGGVAPGGSSRPMSVGITHFF